MSAIVTSGRGELFDVAVVARRASRSRGRRPPRARGGGTRHRAAPADRRGSRSRGSPAPPRRAASSGRGGCGSSPARADPRRMKLCRERTAFTICGTTVSSYPMMPGKSGAPLRSRCDQVVADLVFDGASLDAAGSYRRAEFVREGAGSGGHARILPENRKRLRCGAMPIVYAHRGGAALRPENTIAAFDHGHGARRGWPRVRRPPVERRRRRRPPRRDARADDERPRRSCARTALSSRSWMRAVTSSIRRPLSLSRAGCGVPTLREVLDRYPGDADHRRDEGRRPRLARAVVDEIRAARGRRSRGASVRSLAVPLGAVRAVEPALRTGAAAIEEPHGRCTARGWAGRSGGRRTASSRCRRARGRHRS